MRRQLVVPALTISLLVLLSCGSGGDDAGEGAGSSRSTLAPPTTGALSVPPSTVSQVPACTDAFREKAGPLIDDIHRQLEAVGSSRASDFRVSVDEAIRYGCANAGSSAMAICAEILGQEGWPLWQQNLELAETARQSGFSDLVIQFTEQGASQIQALIGQCALS